MGAVPADRTLVDHLVATTGLTAAEAARVVEDVVAFHAEPVEDYVRRRHAELKTHGARNPRSSRDLAEELAHRVVAAPAAQRAPAAPDRLRIEERSTDMCGIVGYVGSQQAAPLLLEGLGRLEHRGYDSAGVAVLGPGKESRCGWRRRPAGCAT